MARLKPYYDADHRLLYVNRLRVARVTTTIRETYLPDDLSPVDFHEDYPGSGRGLEDTRLRLEDDMEFGLLPGTTWDHLFHAALTKSHVPLRDPSGGTVWYATAKAVAPLFTLHGVWYLETQNATYELVGISVPEKVRVKQFLKDVLRLVRWRLGF